MTKQSTPPSTETPQTPQKKTKPDYYVHAVIPHGRTTRIGSSLGVIFNHGKGAGFTIYLDASPIPVDGRIEMVCYPPKP